MPEPASHTAAGLTIGTFGWASTVMLGFDPGVMMLAMIGSLMAQARHEPCLNWLGYERLRWLGYVAPVVGYSIFSLALTKIAIFGAEQFISWHLNAAAPAIAFILAFFRVQLIQLGNKVLERLPDMLGKKEGN